MAHIVLGLYKEKPLLSMFGSFGFMLQSIIYILMVYQQENSCYIYVDSMYLHFLVYINIPLKKKSLQLRILKLHIVYC